MTRSLSTRRCAPWVYAQLIGGLIALAVLHISPVASLVGQEQAHNKSPRIILTDQRFYELADGLLVERVRKAGYRLSATVIDDDPAVVSVDLAHFRNADAWGKLPGSEQTPLEGTETSLQPTTTIEYIAGDYSTNLTVELRLKPGLSMLIIRATDEKTGEISRRDYHVLYTPPFYSTRWFAACAALMALAALAFLRARKHRRRAAMRKRRYNPYVAGSPVHDENLFLGRERLIKKVLQTIHNNSVMLYGERRIGKTSILHYLRRRLAAVEDREYAFYPVYIDLQGTPQEHFFSTLREEIQAEFPWGPGEIERHGGNVDPETDYRRLIGDLRAIIGGLSTRTTKKAKVVLLIDEIDELNNYEPRVNQRLRSLFMRNFSENLAAVVSGVAIKKRWEGEGSPWYNFFEEMEVAPFLRADAEELVVRPVRGLFKYKKEAVDRIISLAGCKPYLIQKMCVALVNRMYETGQKVITPADVDTVRAAAKEL